MQKDEEVGYSRKIHGKNGKVPVDDLDGKATEFSGIIREYPDIRFIDKKWGLRVIGSMILRQTSDMEGARGTRQ